MFFRLLLSEVETFKKALLKMHEISRPGKRIFKPKKQKNIDNSNRTSSVNVFVILKIEIVNIGAFPSIEK